VEYLYQNYIKFKLTEIDSGITWHTDSKVIRSHVHCLLRLTLDRYCQSEIRLDWVGSTFFNLRWVWLGQVMKNRPMDNSGKEPLDRIAGAAYVCLDQPSHREVNGPTRSRG